jgi:hypothetical protein
MSDLQMVLGALSSLYRAQNDPKWRSTRDMSWHSTLAMTERCLTMTGEEGMAEAYTTLDLSS